jgi:hypothetical protein
MQRIFKKHLILAIILFIGIGVLAAGFVFFLRFIEKRSVRVLEIKEEIATYEINKRSFSEEAQEIKALEARVLALEEHVVTSATLPGVLSYLETLAGERGVIFQITGVSTPTEKDQKKLRIEFSLEGSFALVQEFLDLLLKQPFATAFTRLEFSAEPKIQPLEGDPVVAPLTDRWRVLGTLEILSF